MWLLLVAAGTGYLARCRQKARKFKSGSRVFKQNAALHVSQRSPSCTPRRGRSTTSSRRSLRKRSQSAKGVNRKLLPGRKEGRLAKTHTRDLDENLGSPDKFFEEFLLGEDLFGPTLKDQDTTGQVQTHLEVNCLHGNNYKEPYQSLSTMCMQDHWRETALCMEAPLLFTADDDAKTRDHSMFCSCVLPNKKPISGILHGFPATTLDFVKNQLEMVASPSKGCLDCSSKPTENALFVSDLNPQLVYIAPRFQIPKIKTMGDRKRQSFPFKFRESTEQAFGFVAKVARDLGQRTCSTFKSRFWNRMGRKPFLEPGLLQNTKDVFVCKKLSYERPRNSIPLEEKRDKHGLGPYVLHSHLLKALLDPELLDQCHRCNNSTISISNYDLENAMVCSTDSPGLIMATDQRSTQNSDKTSSWKPSKGPASEVAKSTNQGSKFISEPLCERGNRLLSSTGSLVALGVAMGVLFVANGRNCQFEDLHKLLKKTNSMIEELKIQVDSRLESDPLKVPKVQMYSEKEFSNLAVADGMCPWNAHSHPDTKSCKSTAGKSSLDLFSADNHHTESIFPQNHLAGLNDLEAELEAELQLMELNVYNRDLDEFEWRTTQSNEKSWQPEGDDVYVDIDVRESMPVQAADQLYESDFVLSPLELERRLWQVLEQRHEERICELENDLHITHERVTAKEVEIQWWKDRVWWLMETSLGGKQSNSQSLFIE